MNLTSKIVIVFVIILTLLLSGIGVAVYLTDDDSLLDENEKVEFKDAFISNNISDMEKYSKEGKRLNFTFEDGTTPLNIVIELGRTDLAINMLDTGFDLTLIEGLNYADSITSIISEYDYEAENKQQFQEIIRLLVNQVEDQINMEDEDGYSILTNAIMFNKSDVLDVLLEKEVDVNKLYNGASALHYACSEGVSVEIIEKLVQSGADINLKDSNGNTPLMRSIKELNDDLINYLLNLEIDIDVKNSNNDSALHIAVNYNYEYAASKLVEAGIDKTIVNKDSKTAEQLANELGFSNIESIIKGQN